MPWVQARSSRLGGGGGDTPAPLPGLLYLGVGMERLWIVCSASIGSDDQKEEKWFLLLGTSSEWVPWDSVCFHCLWFPRRGVSRLGFSTEHVGEEILPGLADVESALFQKGLPEKAFLSIKCNAVRGDRARLEDRLITTGQERGPSRRSVSCL